MKKVKKNRWLIALSAIAIHLSIGSVYAYSVFKKPLEDMFGWTSTEVTLSFTIAIFFLGMSAATMGRFVEKWGPRKSATIAAIFFSIGTAGTGVAVELGSLPLYYLTYGVLGGIGLGIGYIAPVSTLVKWFPDKRGVSNRHGGYGVWCRIDYHKSCRNETYGIIRSFNDFLHPWCELFRVDDFRSLIYRSSA